MNHKAPPDQPAGLRLYNLDTDINEANNVAADHPDEVKRLQKFVDIAVADLAVGGRGKGCRPPGKVDNPQPLRMRVLADTIDALAGALSSAGNICKAKKPIPSFLAAEPAQRVSRRSTDASSVLTRHKLPGLLCPGRARCRRVFSWCRVEFDFGGAEGAGELVHGARADDGGGDDGVVEQPGEGDVGGLFVELFAEGFPFFELGAHFVRCVFCDAFAARRPAFAFSRTPPSRPPSSGVQGMMPRP